MDVFDRAKELGIQTEFVDGQGHRHVTDETALKIILDAMPERTPSRLLDGPVVIRTGQITRTELNPAAALPVSWEITAGREVIARGETRQRVIAWPTGWQEGIYRLRLVDAAALAEEVSLIVSPPRAFTGELIAAGCSPSSFTVSARRATGASATSPIWPPCWRSRPNSARTVSASIRCTLCSTTSRPTAAPIRPTAGCFSTRFISTSNRSLNSSRTAKPPRPPPSCAKAISSITSA
jgi:hypothetical protein